MLNDESNICKKDIKKNRDELMKYEEVLYGSLCSNEEAR